MDILRLYQDYHIPHQTEGHKHCRPGWANTECPFCTGNPGLHLGVTLDGSHFYCWRCGWKPVYKALARLLNVDETEVREIVRRYGGRSRAAPEPAVQIRRHAHRLPSGTGPMAEQHRRYLRQRRFDPDELERVWGLLGTGPIAPLDHIDYKHRILIPINWNGKRVSFTSRDITERHHLRYLSCPKERELIDHKHILYARQETWTDVGIAVEGPADAWRLGPMAFATFGIEFTNWQTTAIARAFRRVVVVFDDDSQAQIQASKLVSELRFLGVRSVAREIVGDPGAMSQDEADFLVKDVTRKVL